MTWKRHKEYRDSGVEWLGNVPVGWQVKRLRFNILTNPTKAEVKNITGDALVSFVPMESVSEYGGLSLDQTKSLDEVSNGYTYFRNGDVLVAKITPCFENGKGSIAEGLENGVGFGTTELHVLRPQRKIDCRYLFYLTISYAFRQIGKSYMYGAGGQKRVPDDFIRNLRHPIPDISEQCIIAAFLDRETERIDALIAKKERQIELLQEKRTALISHAVTKGLNPDVKMKDSGIEWLGEIPEHWEVNWLRHLFRFEKGQKAQLYTKEYVGIYPGDFPVYSGQTEGNGVLGYIDTFDYETDESIFVTTVGAKAMSTKIVKGKYSLSQNCALLISKNPKLSSIYYEGFLADIFRYEKGSISLIMQPSLRFEDLHKYKVLVPPIKEQHAIASFLDQETKRINTLTSKIRESIVKLSEYRTALISATVTGKIDVRKEVA